MCYNRSLNTKMNRLHEQCLRMAYNDQKTNFNELLAKDGSVSIHHQNFQKFAVEMFDLTRGLSPEVVNYYLNSESQTLQIKAKVSVSNPFRSFSFQCYRKP